MDRRSNVLCRLEDQLTRIDDSIAGDSGLEKGLGSCLDQYRGLAVRFEDVLEKMNAQDSITLEVFESWGAVFSAREKLEKAVRRSLQLQKLEQGPTRLSSAEQFERQHPCLSRWQKRLKQVVSY